MRRYDPGITLTEAVISMAILGSVVLMTGTAVRFLGALNEQNAKFQVEMVSDPVLFNMAKEINNAKSIWSVGPSSCTIRVYNTAKGFDPAKNPDLFVEGKDGFITYIYSPAEACLMKTVDFTADEPHTVWNVKKYFKNLLQQPDEHNPIFEPLNDPVSSVRIVLRFNKGIFAKAPVMLKTDATVWSFHP
ncbi:MAG: hypothetical protein LHV69_01690 [Elusimicrobia bacterium]|nr:hypothetical protein [Candidatus Obscuribacterium magneticum]